LKADENACLAAPVERPGIFLSHRKQQFPMRQIISYERTKSRIAALCALVRASVSLHFQMRTSRILAERFCVIGNEVSYDIKKMHRRDAPAPIAF